MNVIGDVRGKRAIIVDDEIDTAGTLTEIVRALEREGVTEIYACATHGVLSDPAVDRIRIDPSRGRPDRLGPVAGGKRLGKITTLSVAPLIGEAIKRIHRGESVGALFSSEVSFTQEMLLWEDGQPRRMDTRNEPGHGGDGAPTDDGASRSDSTTRGDWRPRRDRATDEPAAPPARRQGRHRAAAGPRARTGATPLQSQRWGLIRPRGGLPPLETPR